MNLKEKYLSLSKYLDFIIDQSTKYIFCDVFIAIATLRDCFIEFYLILK